MRDSTRLTRDIFGSRELYYVTCGDDVETFRDLPARVFREGHGGFDPVGITSYLTFRYPVGNGTMFRDYRAVPAGAALVDGAPTYYWHPRFSCSSASFEAALERIQELLIDSIRLLTRGKKVGITLGGVDSSLICALTKKLYPDQELRTYSVGFDGADEFEYARIVAEQYKMLHKEVFVSKADYIGPGSLLRPLIRQKGAPLHPNEPALAYAEKVAVADGCEIVLCGEGADDIFGGYGQNMRMYMNYTGEMPYAAFLLDNYRYFSLEDRASLIRDEYLVDDVGLLDTLFEESGVPEDIRDLMFYFIQRVHTVGLITRGANAMRFHNLPLGFPYIYPELVDYVNALPFEYKVRWKSARGKAEAQAQGMYFRDISEEKDIPKYILKKLAERYLPRELVYRPKRAFPVPFQQWFGQLTEWPLDQTVFKTTYIGHLNGWKKFMVINLNTFIEEFALYKRDGDRRGK